MFHLLPIFGLGEMELKNSGYIRKSAPDDLCWPGDTAGRLAYFVAYKFELNVVYGNCCSNPKSRRNLFPVVDLRGMWGANGDGGNAGDFNDRRGEIR